MRSETFNRSALTRAVGVPGYLMQLGFGLGLVLLLTSCVSQDSQLADDRSSGSKWHNLALDRLVETRQTLTNRDLPRQWDREMEFFTQLAEKRIVSMADAAEAFILFLGESPWDSPLDNLVTRLVERDVFRTSWTVDDDTPLTKGKAAFMACQASDVRAGLWVNLFGPSERYCYRDALYVEIVQPGSLHRYVTGEEFLDVLSECHLYRDEHRDRSQS